MNEEQTQKPGGFFPWLRSLGIVRRSDDRWFTGVASGIAQKANIDPLLVRGIFVVLALLGGPGVLLYIACWLLLPDSEGRIHTQEVFNGRGSPWVIVVAVTAAIWLIFGAGIFRWDIVSIFGAPAWISALMSWIFWIAILLTGAYFVHRAFIKQGTRAAQPQEGNSSMNFMQEGTTKINEAAEKVNEWGNNLGETVTKHADDWTQKYAENHERTSLGSGYVLITLALALLAGGGTILWGFMTSGFVNTNSEDLALKTLLPGLIAATIVFAISMIIAGIRGKKSGTVGFFGFLGVASLIVSAVLPTDSQIFWIGDAKPSVTGQSTAMLMGDLEVDLREFDTNKSETDYSVNMLFGDINIIAPDTRPTTITVTSTGSVTEERTDVRVRNTGVFAKRTIKINEDKPGPELTVRVHLVAGDVIIHTSEKELTK